MSDLRTCMPYLEECEFLTIVQHAYAIEENLEYQELNNQRRGLKNDYEEIEPKCYEIIIHISNIITY